MNLVYYFLGSFVYLVLSVLYRVFREGSVNLTQGSLFEMLIQAGIAGLSFFIADYLIAKRSNKS